MKKMLLLCFLALGLSLAAQTSGEHIEVTPQDMEAMLNPPPQPGDLNGVSTLIMNGDTLTLIGQDADAVIREALNRLKEKPNTSLGDWLLWALATLASFVAFVRKWWGWLSLRLRHIPKDDTIVYIVSFLIGLGWSLLDGGISAEEVFTKFSGVFTVAVGSYKLLLRSVWNWISGLFKKETPADAGR